tara:strand:+ start:3342 stop:4547 length:1206 start_codon:yes stop_codon:yes gene_type:complete
MGTLTFFATLEKFMRSGINAAFYFWIATIIDKESFGLLTVMLASLAFFTPLLAGGLEAHSVATFLTLKDQNQLEHKMLEISTLLTIYSIIFFCIILIFYKYNEISIFILLVTGLPLALSRYYDSNRYLEYANFAVKKNLIIDYAGIVLSSLLKLLAIQNPDNLVEYVLLIIIFDMYSNSLIRLVLSKNIKYMRYVKVPKTLVSTSVILIFAGLLQAGFTKIDLIMVPIIFDKSMAAGYGFSIRIFDIFMILTSVISSFLPGYIKKISTTTAGFNLKLMRTGLKISVPLLLLTFISKYPIEFILTKYLIDYLPSFNALFGLFLWLPILSLIGSINNFILLSHDRARVITINAGICFVINVILNYLLSVPFGMTGFAISTIICCGLNSIVLPAISFRVLKIKL